MENLDENGMEHGIKPPDTATRYTIIQYLGYCCNIGSFQQKERTKYIYMTISPNSSFS